MHRGNGVGGCAPERACGSALSPGSGTSARDGMVVAGADPPHNRPQGDRVAAHVSPPTAPTRRLLYRRTLRGLIPVQVAGRSGVDRAANQPTRGFRARVKSAVLTGRIVFAAPGRPHVERHLLACPATPPMVERRCSVDPGHGPMGRTGLRASGTGTALGDPRPAHRAPERSRPSVPRVRSHVR